MAPRTFHRDDATFAAIAGSDLPREVLSAVRTYYVRTDGSDSNTGLVDSAGGAFQTLQKAINVCLTLDLNGNAVTIQVGSGTYTAGIALTSPFVGGNVTLKGDTSTPTNVVVSTTSSDCIKCSNNAVLYVQGLKLQTTTSGVCLYAEIGATININGSMNFGAAGSWHNYAVTGGTLFFTSNYTISGGAQFHYICTDNGLVFAFNVGTITVSGSPAFSNSFAYADRLGNIVAHANTFSGAATGQRYNAATNSVIFTAGGGANYFPGNVAGATSAGGQYV